MFVVTCAAAFFVNDFDGGRPFRAAFETDLWTLAETSAFVFVAYAGVTKVAAIGGEVKDEKNLPASHASFFAYCDRTLFCSRLSDDGSHPR